MPTQRELLPYQLATIAQVAFEAERVLREANGEVGLKPWRECEILTRSAYVQAVRDLCSPPEDPAPTAASDSEAQPVAAPEPPTLIQTMFSTIVLTMRHQMIGQ